MSDSLVFLFNASFALAAAFLAGVAAQRVGLPAIVGYILAGVLIGPFTPGPTGDLAQISALANLGIILLMFGIGVELSLRELWRAGPMVVLASAVQTLATIVVAALLIRVWGWPFAASVYAGAAVAVSSTVVAAGILAQRGELGSSHGRLMISWLVTQDILTVVLMVTLPALVGGERVQLAAVAGALLRAGGFVLGMIILGRHLIPRVLLYVARTGNRELFLLAATSLALGTAFVSQWGFGLSLALGAFVAGLVISESEITHHLTSEILPIREVFVVLFFVSAGMLANPGLIWQDTAGVLGLLLLTVLVKGLIVLLLALLLAFPLGSALLVAAGLAQMGEFSFLLAGLGLSQGALTADRYQMMLLVTILSLLLAMPLFDLSRRLRGRLGDAYLLRPRVPVLSERLAGLDHTVGHAVICGFGRVGRHAAELFRRLEVPHVLVELNPERVEAIRRLGSPFIYGDATRPEILQHARVGEARLLLVALPDPVAAYHAAEAALRLNPRIQVVARARTTTDAEELRRLGVHEIVVPTLEGSLEMTRQALIRLGFGAAETQAYVDAIRDEHYLPLYAGRTDYRLLSSLRGAVPSLGIEWVPVAGSELEGRSLAACNVRGRSGASVVAVLRDGGVVANPDPDEILRAGDALAVMGSREELGRFRSEFLRPPRPPEGG